MNGLMRKSVLESINIVMEQIAGADENLAALFRILGDIVANGEEIPCGIFDDEERGREESDGKAINGDRINGRPAGPIDDKERRRKELARKRRNKEAAKRITDKISRVRGPINTIPFGEPSNCLKECVAIAFGLFRSKDGFKGIAKKVIDYWHNCGEKNCLTLIVTDAWDINDFNRKYKDDFDRYASSKNKDNAKHTVVIILYGVYGFSLQYFK